jgi:hypothetical protein
MRKHRIWCLGALGLALALVIPGTAGAAGTQRVEAGFLPEFNANVPFPPPVLEEPPGFTKAGTIRIRLFLENYGNNPFSAGIFDIHAPNELRYNTKGLAECDPADIQGQSDEGAREICEDALIGQGSATAFLPPSSSLTGGTTLFNGTPQNGFPTVLFHSTAGTPITRSAGGQVPDGTPIVDTEFTNSRKYTDEKIAKKAKKTKKKAKKASGSKAKKLKKKAKKLKQKSKKSWTQARCIDGEAVTRVVVTYTDGSTQGAEDTQECVVP